MDLIIVGAGRVGCSLAELALKEGHNVTLIESDEKKAQEATQKLDATVLHGNIAEGAILEEAGADGANALIATTGDDSANLMAMFLGKELGIKTLLSIVNNINHRRLFERLEVHVIANPELILAQHLYGLLRQPKLEEVITLPGGEEVFEITVKQGSPLVGTTLEEAKQIPLLTDHLLIVLLKRGKQRLVPASETTFSAGDHLTVFSQGSVSEKELKVFTG